MSLLRLDVVTRADKNSRQFVLLSQKFRGKYTEMAPYVQEACCVIIATILKKRKKRNQGRNCWCRQWIGHRHSLGADNSLLMELQIEDPSSYKKFLRMDHESFNELVALVEPFIRKQDTNMRESISTGERLALTL